MGSENSKSEENQESQRNQIRRGVGQRLYTEDEINRALAYQKRMFEEKQMEMQTSSRIYPNLQTQNLNTTHGPSISSTTRYSVTPTAPLENLLPSINSTVSRETYQQRISPSQASTPLKRPATSTSARTAYTAPSAGPSNGAPTFSRPSNDTPTSVRPPNGTPTSTGPSNSTPTSAGPSNGTPTSVRPPNGTPTSTGPSNSTPTSAGTSNSTPTSAGPSNGTPTSAGPYKRNQKINQAPRTRSKSRAQQNKRESNGIVNCVTCKGPLSIHIYQCSNGHSSCNGCRFKMARCGNCSGLITDMRNITLESTLAEVTINTEERVKCSNAKDGCCLHFKRTELQNHVKECPFNIISCPVMEFSGDCSWKGTIKQLATHFSDAHPMHCEAEVNKELHIIVMELDYKVMHLVKIGSHQFLVHIQVDTSLKNIYMVTQFLGTKFSASKWTYEWHIYNKKEPRRKFEYIDVCKSNTVPVSEIVNDHNCAIINMDYAKSFLDGGKLNYKFYIKKQFNNKKDINTTSN